MTSPRPTPPASWTADPFGAWVAALRRRGDPTEILTGILLSLIFVVAVARSAWICDDAYINLRTVLNFAEGRGLTWNTTERVQAFTSPLWLLLFALFHRLVFPSELAVYFSTLAISFAFSFAAAAILVGRLGRTGRARIMILAGLAGSKAVIEYSTGGLENPLSHLLLAWFCAVWFGPRDGRLRPFWLALAASALCLSRLDLALIVAPPLALELWERRNWRTVGLLALGFMPLLAWEVFSVIYFGFPFPNTAYAKLSASFGVMVRLRQGLAYFANSLRWDYPTLTLIGLGLVLAVSSRERRRLALAAGIALYLLYILRIGGDFMSGRMFTPPLIAALALIGQWDGPMGNRWPARCFLAAMLPSLALPLHPLRTGVEYYWTRAGLKDSHQIADERSWYYESTGLILWRPGYRLPRHDWSEQGKRDRMESGGAPFVAVKGNIGYYGFFAGPNAHIVDPYALSDALLARLPPEPKPFRPGHVGREVPEGYLETLRTGTNVIKDPAIARLYDELALVTRGPLWTRARWRAIARMNFP